MPKKVAKPKRARNGPEPGVAVYGPPGEERVTLPYERVTMLYCAAECWEEHAQRTGDTFDVDMANVLCELQMISWGAPRAPRARDRDALRRLASAVESPAFPRYRQEIVENLAELIERDLDHDLRDSEIAIDLVEGIAMWWPQWRRLRGRKKPHPEVLRVVRLVRMMRAGGKRNSTRDVAAHIIRAAFVALGMRDAQARNLFTHRLKNGVGTNPTAAHDE